MRNRSPVIACKRNQKRDATAGAFSLRRERVMTTAGDPRPEAKSCAAMPMRRVSDDPFVVCMGG